MANSKMSAEEIRAMAAEMDIDQAYELRAEQTRIGDLIKRNRRSLDDARALGHLNADQVKEVDDLYPVRVRASAADRVASLEDQLAKAREKAAKEATDQQGTDDAVTEAA